MYHILNFINNYHTELSNSNGFIILFTTFNLSPFLEIYRSDGMCLNVYFVF
jgi:hypothetical protein